MNGTTIQRRQLYEEVWREPVVKLAPRYGLSDTGLSKVCDRLNVPKPPRGYWAKIEAGQILPTAALPSSGPSVYRRGRVVHSSTIAESTLCRLEVSSPMTIAECLPITQRIAAYRDAAATSDDRGWPRYIVGNLISVEVSQRCQSRSLLVINALFETLIAAGHYSNERNIGPVGIGNTFFRFRLREDSPPVNRRGQDEFCDESMPAVPTGVFNLHGYLVPGKYPVARLRDARRTCIEERMSRFVVRLRRLALDCT